MAILHADTQPSAGFDRYLSFCASQVHPLQTAFDGAQIQVTQRGETLLAAQCEVLPDTGVLSRIRPGPGREATEAAVLAMLEALSAHHPHWRRIGFGDAAGELPVRALAQRGVLHAERQGLSCLTDMLWQLPELWLADAGSNGYPLSYAMTQGKRHPLRPPKPAGTVYARYIPWLRQVLSFRVETLEQDLDRFHAWMNDPRVAEFWQEAGDLGKHRTYLQALLDDPHMIPLAGCLDGVPFAHFEIYWAKENRIAPFYDAADHDRGWHALVGDDRYRGRAILSSWFPSILHFQFLDDARTQRVMGEPQSNHERQISNLDRAGFAKVKEFDFPHKRALLVMLLRERFFGEHLYGPTAALLRELMR